MQPFKYYGLNKNLTWISVSKCGARLLFQAALTARLMRWLSLNSDLMEA
jgi:hypothetical protein